MAKLFRRISKRDEDSNVYEVSNFDDTFKTLLWAMRFVGVRVSLNDTPTSRLMWNIFYILECIQLFVSCNLEMINMIQTVADGFYIHFFEMMPCVGYMVLALAKSYKIVRYRHVCENLIMELRGMWPQGQVTEEEHRIINPPAKMLEFVAKGYFVLNIFLALLFTLPPYIVIVRKLLGEDVELFLPFHFWLPFELFSRKSPYETLLVLQTWYCVITVFLMYTTDMFFYAYITHLTIQFDLIAIKINKMIHVQVDDQLLLSYPLGQLNNNHATNGNRRDRNLTLELDDKYYKEILTIVKRHQKLIRLSADVEYLFSFSLLINFMNGSIIICFTGFCCVFVEKWNEMIYKIFLATVVSQIWMLSWYGQRLIDASQSISHAIYNCGWHNVSKRVKSLFLIIMIRSQKEVHITTYGFSIVGLASFTTVIKTSWSYFTLLLNIYKQ